ncbi:hypothetical protein L7F22_066677 [Adiantum nelumboides]|nr:hypothetical protein [Adiantum nelumboides]
MNEAGSFQASGHTCHDTNDQFMINALLMQHQHHDQFGAGGYHINCNYQPSAAAALGLPHLQSPRDHHYGAHLSSISGALGSSSTGVFPVLGGSIGALGGGIPAGSAHSGSGITAYGGGPNTLRISASGSGIQSSQNGGIRGCSTGIAAPSTPPSRYESQKRRDWNTFLQYLRNRIPALTMERCNGEHVLQFLRYLDQFGKTKVHGPGCPYFGLPHPPAPCGCPLRQAWGSLDALIGRLRAAYEEYGRGKPESNPFGARQVQLFLREVREHQAKARGIAYEKKKRKRPKPPAGTCDRSTDTTANFQVEPPAGSSSSNGFLVSGCN